MNDYKELIGDIGDILIAHPSESVSKMFLQEAVNAIEQLVWERDELYEEVMNCTKKIGCKAIEQVKKERDAAIYEMRREADNCKWCRWHDKDHHIKSCVCPETCCVDGNPDRWEWRGVQNE